MESIPHRRCSRGPNQNITKVECWFRELDPYDAQTYVTGDKIGQAWNALKLYDITDKAPPSVAQIMEHYVFVDAEMRPTMLGDDVDRRAAVDLADVQRHEGYLAEVLAVRARLGLELQAQVR